MADFFDRLMVDAKKAAKKAAATVVDRTAAASQIAKNKTRETVDGVKLEIEIKKVRANLEKEYQMLGKIVYQIEKGVLNRDDEILQASCKRIDRCMGRIEELEKKKHEKKEEAAPQPEKQVQEEPEPEFKGYAENEEGYPMMKFCPYCKAGNTPDAKVCVYCHKPL